MKDTRIRGVFIVNLVLLLALFFIIPASADAATYYMRSDGSAANKAAATSCDAAGTAMSIATHNVQTFSPGDTIYVCGNGGNYTTELTNPSSGSSNLPITYIGTSTPTWNMSARNWYTAGRDYLVIDGMTFNTTSGYSIQLTTSDYTTLKNIISVAPNGVYFQTAVSPTIENVTSTASSNDGIRIAGSNAVVINPVIVSAGKYGLNLDSINGATITGGSISNTQFEGIRVTNVNNSAVSINGTNLSNVGLNGGATSAGIYYTGASVTGTDFSIEDVEIANARGLGGIYIMSAPFETHRATISNVTVEDSTFGIRANNANNIDISDSAFLDNTSDGIFFEGTSTGIVISNVVVGNSGRDGISFGEGVTSSTVRYSEIYGSGQVDVISSGDGITTHASSTDFSFYSNLIWGNRNSGFALVGNGSANVYNNTVYFNGDSTSANMGVRGGFYNSGSDSVFNVRNNIFVGNFPYEVQVRDISVYSASTFDFNQFHHIGNNVVEDNFVYIGNGSINWAAYHANYESNSNYSNPDFVSPTSNFHLLFSSPAINSGTDVGLTEDADGAPIVGIPDMGAYEYQGVPDLIPPTVSVTVPTDGSTVFGDTTVTADASDNVGVEDVKFYLNGAELEDEDDSAPYSITWDTTSSPDGSHTLFAVARDTEDNYATSSPVTVTVTNTSEDSGASGRSGQRRQAPSLAADSVTAASQASATSSLPFADLTMGATGEEVRSLQLWLMAHGYSIPAGATGYFGPQTQTALALYRAGNTVSWPVANVVFYRPLSLGSTGTDVAVLQQILKTKGFYLYPEITGFYGPITFQAVANFQRSVGLDHLGFVGPTTRAILNSLPRL